MKPRCERITGFTPREDGWGSYPNLCGRQTRLTSWIDSRGDVHYSCRDHVRYLLSRHPTAGPQEEPTET